MSYRFFSFLFFILLQEALGSCSNVPAVRVQRSQLFASAPVSTPRRQDSPISVYPSTVSVLFIQLFDCFFLSQPGGSFQVEDVAAREREHRGPGSSRVGAMAPAAAAEVRD